MLTIHRNQKVNKLFNKIIRGGFVLSIKTTLCIFSVSLDPTKRYLYLQVLGGKAFLEHLQEAEPLPGQVTSMFTLHLHFKGQRFRSRPAVCSCEPDIHEGNLKSGNSSLNACFQQNLMI